MSVTPDPSLIAAMEIHPLFAGMADEKLGAVLADSRTAERTYHKGDLVYAREHFSRSLAFVEHGALRVSTGGGLSIHEISAGQCFGVAALFSDETDYVTDITALRNTKVIFFPQELVEELLQKDSVFAMNYVRFLNGRIRFLNRKIALFTGGSSRLTLEKFLALEAVRSGNHFILPVPITELARRLDMSRSSLYRAFDCLEKEKIIQRFGRQIVVLDEASLLRKGVGRENE